MPSRRLTAVLVSGLLPLALTACGSGKSPHTYEQRPTVDAAQASLGDLELRNVTIKAPASGAAFEAGGEATATMYVVNLGEAPDRLTGVTSPVATSVDVVPAGGTATGVVDIGGRRSVGAADFSMVLRGLTREVRPGEHVEMTFTFTRAGRRTLLVPVGVYASPLPREVEENPFEHAEGEPS